MSGCPDRRAAVLPTVSVWVAESFVHHLYIAPELRGRGLGGDLLAALEPWLAQPWRLKCVRANRHALAFYAAHGWREVGSGEAEQGPFAILEWQAPSPFFKPAPACPP